MRSKKVIALVLSFAMILCFTSCGGGTKKETVTVTFDTDGGSSVESQTIEKGTAVVKPDTPKKDGYIFDKWTLNGNAYEFGSAVNEDTTLKALWLDPNADKDQNEGQSGGSGNDQSSGQSGIPTGAPDIKLNTDKYVFEYHNNEASNSIYQLSVIFENGADPNSKITWTATDPDVASVTEDGIVVAHRKLGYSMITATTEEGYSDYCHVYVMGTALKIFVTGGGGELQQGANFEMSETYELSVVKQIYTDEKTDTVYLTDQCEFKAAAGINFDPQTQYYGIISFDRRSISAGEYQIQFVDTANNVSSDIVSIVLK